MTMQIPIPLREGARVGLVAPSGAIRTEGALERAIAAVAAQGFEPIVGESCGKVYGYLSGPDELRARDINRMFRDDSVEAIFCIRGGYGAARLLGRLDYDAIRANPKTFLGYSDATALHAALNNRCGLVTFHGPMPASDWIQDSFDGWSMAHLRRMLMQPIFGTIANPSGFETETLTGGRAYGRLVGGNLSLVSGLLGTPWAVDARGAVLFLEDVGENTYKIDHMLTQLRAAGLFSDCAGVVLGAFTDCEIEHPGYGLDVRQIVQDLVAPMGKPLMMGLRAGHCQPTLTLPLGAQCALDADAGTLTILP